jgi:cytosine/uracil/thiamine/allantoin permease
MDKKSPFFTATIASIIYFIIFLLLKYLLFKREKNNINIDWLGALVGAIVFWLVIFVVHQFLKTRYSE